MSSTPEELLASLPHVHPTMVATYLAEGQFRVLLQIRDLLAELVPLPLPSIPAFPVQRQPTVEDIFDDHI